MKNYSITLMLTLMISACSYSSVDGGEEAVMTYKPWIFGHGGVDEDPISTGAIYTVWSTSVNRYNIKPMQYTEQFIDLTASDNVAIDFHAYVTLQIVKGKSPVIHENFGEDWYITRIREPFRTIVRNEGRTRSSIDLRTSVDTINQSQQNMLKLLVKYLESQNIPVVASKVVIGKVIPPNEVLKEAERTAAQKQREKTQVARAKAETSRINAERQKAIADKAYATEFSMTTEQFLRNKELDIIAEKENVSIVMGITPFVSIKR